MCFQANEELRARYRYLDLRRTALSENIKLRSKVAHIVRSVLHQNGSVSLLPCIPKPIVFRLCRGGHARSPEIFPRRCPGIPGPNAHRKVYSGLVVANSGTPLLRPSAVPSTTETIAHVLRFSRQIFPDREMLP